tara:strand:+ start:512 stop:1360 length:849 start_codon:yes stop_codon:yes gene_type:complete
MNNEITIVLISHKSKNLIINFVKNIYKKFNIIVIDNSNDVNLQKEIKKNYPNIIIKLIVNNGYGSSINYASKLIKTKYFLISNPDVEGINEKNIQKFLSAASKLDDNFSSLGPRYLNINSKSHVQSDINEKISEMKFISGACMFFKKKNFDLIGGFDENFFLYFEESDFCLRAHKKKKNYQLNEILINHKIGTSVTIKNYKERKELENLYTWHFIWSKFYYYKKHYSYMIALLYFIPIIIRIIFRIIFFSYKGNKENTKKYKVRLEGLMTSIKCKKSDKRLN